MSQKINVEIHQYNPLDIELIPRNAWTSTFRCAHTHTSKYIKHTQIWGQKDILNIICVGKQGLMSSSRKFILHSKAWLSNVFFSFLFCIFLIVSSLLLHDSGHKSEIWVLPLTLGDDMTFYITQNIITPSKLSIAYFLLRVNQLGLSITWAGDLSKSETNEISKEDRNGPYSRCHYRPLKLLSWCTCF